METVDYLARIVSFTALVISAIALFITFRKDSHRIALTRSEGKHFAITLGVSNDSSFSVGIWGVGSFRNDGTIKWIDSIGDHLSNKFVVYPIRVEARSAFTAVVISGREVPSTSVPHGYCVQLESDRTFVLPHTVSKSVALKMHFRSILSRITAGSFGFPKYQPIKE